MSPRLAAVINGVSENAIEIKENRFARHEFIQSLLRKRV
jgi:hypothetical protein